MRENQSSQTSHDHETLTAQSPMPARSAAVNGGATLSHKSRTTSVVGLSDVVLGLPMIVRAVLLDAIISQSPTSSVPCASAV